MLESLLKLIRDKCEASVTDLVEGMLAHSGPVCLLVRDPVLFPFRPYPHRVFSLDIFEFEFGFESKSFVDRIQLL